MELIVKDYKRLDGTAALTIPEGQITLLAGDNGHGKTSVLEALSAVLRADSKMLGLPKKALHKVVHHGADDAFIQLRWDGGARRIDLPKGEIWCPDGTGMNADAVATGDEKFARLGDADRAAFLAQRLDAVPNRERLSSELEGIKHLPADFKTKLLDTVCGTEKLPGKGWDAGEKFADDSAKLKKGEFKNATGGVQWGSDQGLTFIPANFDPTKTAEDLQAEVVAAQEAVERLIAQNAVSEREVADLKALADQEAAAQEQAEDAKAKLAEIEAEIAKLQALTECSGCGLKGSVKGGKLVAADPKLFERRDATKLRMSVIDSNLSASRKAREKLATIGEQADNGKEMTAAREKLALAQARVAARKKKDDGTRLHHEITAILEAAKLCAPEGLRYRLVLEKLPEFNEKLARLCQIGGWGKVTIDHDFDVNYSGISYMLLSKGHRYRVDVTLQVAFTQLAHGKIVLLDDLECVGREGRNGLMTLLRHAGLTAVIGYMLSPEKDGTIKVPDLKRMQNPLGVTYWIEKGRVTEHEAKEPQAVAS